MGELIFEDESCPESSTILSARGQDLFRAVAGLRIRGMSAGRAQVNELEDASLLAMICSSNRGEAESAFLELYDRHQRSVRVCLGRYHLSHSAIDDVSQETWQKVWLKAGSWNETGSVRGWLLQIAKNAAVDIIRSEERRKAAPLLPEVDHPPSSLPSPHDNVMDHETFVAFVRCRDRLPEQQRQVLIRRLDGVTSAVIATELGIPSAQVYKLLHNAKARMQECVGRELAK